MTKEEQQFNQWFDWYADGVKVFEEADMKQAYLTGAEPREKQIQIDTEQIRALQKQNGELTDRVKELEAQIEKMKCCFNCKFDNLEPPEIISNGVCKNCIHYSKWELED